MKSRGKKKEVRKKEEIAESWCFLCKDGGDLRICDHRECMKSFHPGCVGKDDSFLESSSHWVCAWHTCFRCNRTSHFHCYTCTNAVCRRCLSAADFSQVKGKFGFCSCCLKIALLIEEGKDYDSEGEKVDFADLETCEGLFMEYYNIIKKEEGFESTDIYAARDKLKPIKVRKSLSDSEEYDEDEDEDEGQVSDYEDNIYAKKCKKNGKGKRSVREKPSSQTPKKSNKNEFIGWASRSLIEFLSSIGKNTDEELSQRDVTSIINEYVKENKLVHQERRKMIVCDARLQSLFRRKTISKNRVYELLEAHFAENLEESEEDEMDYDSEDEDAGVPIVCKRQRKLDVENKSTKKELDDNVRQSCFASIVVENLKLVYLKRSLLRELLKQPKTFEEKVSGCFVRVKSDPYDYLSRISHHLIQVEGVKTVPDGQNNMEVFLLLSAMPKEISVDLLSDGDFSEEECEDLRQKMLAGQLKRPTVGELQQKAKILHEDLTKHWINKELALLPKLIDRANEKGWRRELFEYVERRKRLQTPSEQSKLLANVPKVIPDVEEQLHSNSGDIIDDMSSDKGSPQSIIRCNSSVPDDGGKASAKTDHDDISPPETKQPVSEESVCTDPELNHTPDSKLKHVNITSARPAKVKGNQSGKGKFEKMGSPKASQMVSVINSSSDDDDDDDDDEELDGSEREIWCIRGPNGEREKCSLGLLRRWAQNCRYAYNFKAWKVNENEDKAVWLKEVVSVALTKK